MDGKDFRTIERIVFISVLVLAAIGIIEIMVGRTVNSIGLVADGIDSISDSVVSFLVWAGIRISRRAPSRKFPFGYYRVETLASMIVAVIMLTMSAIIFYNAYSRLVNPVEITYPLLGMLTLAGAGITSLSMALVKNRLAGKYNLLSLKADAKNSIKDGTSSFIVLAGVFLSYVGFAWGDPLGAMIVGIYIVFVAINTMKQASLILIDAFNNTKLIDQISGIVDKYPAVGLKDARLRLAGPYIIGELILGVNRGMSIGDLFGIKEKIKSDVEKKIDGVKDLIISAEPWNGYGHGHAEFHAGPKTAKALKSLPGIEKHVSFSKPERG